MSQEFKLNFDGIRDHATPNSGGEESYNLENKNENYPSAGNARNICFSWPDGRSVFLNYAYLIAGEYQPSDNKITLDFTTHTIEIKGTGLDSLYEGLFSHAVKTIVQVDSRYVQVEENAELVIKEIKVQKKENTLGFQVD